MQFSLYCLNLEAKEYIKLHIYKRILNIYQIYEAEVKMQGKTELHSTRNYFNKYNAT